MYQTLYFNKHNTCNLRKLLSFSSYSEGWATYVEYYSYSLNNGLDPDLGELLQHNAAFTLALYAILDVNIHYEGWDIKQVEDYLNHYFRISDSSVITTIYYDIAENPANYLSIMWATWKSWACSARPRKPLAAAIPTWNSTASSWI